MRRWPVGLLAVLAAAVLSLLLAAPASAHTVLVGSDPADGSRLAQSPAAVTLRFNEQVGLDLGYLRVVDSTGQRVDNGPPSHPGGVGSSVSVPLRSGLGDGSYLASYRVISADSHPVAGTVRYVVGDGPLDVGGGGSGSAPVDRAVSTGLATSHWLSFAGVAMVGGSWLVFTLWPAGRRRRAIRRLVWTGWGLAAAGRGHRVPAGGAVRGRHRAGQHRPDEPAGRHPARQRRPVAVAAGAAAGRAGHGAHRAARPAPSGGRVPDGRYPTTRRRPSWAPEAAAIVGAGIVVTFAASGHTRSTNPHWLWVLMDALHLIAMIVWLGGVLVLVVAAFSPAGRGRTGHRGLDDVTTEADRAQLAAGLPVFSRVAMACIATLAVTGTLQAWREVGALDALTSTRYGQLVLVKVALFCAILGLGYLARRVVLRSATGTGRPRRRTSPGETRTTGWASRPARCRPAGAGPAGAALGPAGRAEARRPRCRRGWRCGPSRGCRPGCAGRCWSRWWSAPWCWRRPRCWSRSRPARWRWRPSAASPGRSRCG